MFDADKNPVVITSFPRGTVLLNELMNKLMIQLRMHTLLRTKLFEVRFLTTSINEAVIVLIYKQPLTDNWSILAKQLSIDLGGVIIVGRSRKQKIIINTSNYTTNTTTTNTTDNTIDTNNIEYIKEILYTNTIHTLNQPLIYYQTEGAFSQPNASVCTNMIQWVMDLTRPSTIQQQNGHNSDLSTSVSGHNSDLLELYCGGCTFSIPLSYHFRKVLATEMNKTSVELAIHAIHDNNIHNMQIIRLSSEEFTQAYEQTREFRRLKDAHINLSLYNITTVLVDPPRAGLDEGTCILLTKFQYIIYISCNPHTLIRDLCILCKTHDILSTAVFDQFPYTDHLECGVYLTRRVPVPVGGDVTGSGTASVDTTADATTADVRYPLTGTANTAASDVIPTTAAACEADSSEGDEAGRSVLGKREFEEED